MELYKKGGQKKRTISYCLRSPIMLDTLLLVKFLFIFLLVLVKPLSAVLQ